MTHNVVHFAVHADDVNRARKFYENVFGWRFEPWGPPDFYRIHTGGPEDSGIGGALQKRQQPLEGEGVNGYECTISVDEVEQIAAKVEQHGGTVVVPKMVIPKVGWLIQFRDTEGNVACAMRYDKDAE